VGFGRSYLNREKGLSDLVKTVRSEKNVASGGGSPEIGFHGGASPELVEINAPGVKSNGVWVCRDQRDTRDPPEALAGLGVARGCVRGGGGGFARWRLPVYGVPASGTG
jgi:hypothetical protein